jgi:glycosyltransferase involved in cell wall biosynthesis
MEPLVSILIPAYNSEKWIKETIESALNQTWPRKEIIIVDDGSRDRTFEIARKYESNSVKVLSQENKGGPSARNAALSIAQGDFIQWLDHDDLLAPDKISQQLKKCETVNMDILLSGSFGTFYYNPNRAKFNKTNLWRDLTPLEYFLIKFSESVWLHPTSWLVSRKLTDLAGPWHVEKSPDDDGEYFCRVVAVSNGIKFVPEAKSYWRIGNYGSVSKTRSDKALEALFLSIKLSIEHLRHLEDSEVTRAACLKYLQSRLWHFYPDKKEILRKAGELGEELGGRLSAPKEGWKFEILRKIFGWKFTSKMRELGGRIGALLNKNIEKHLLGCNY